MGLVLLFKVVVHTQSIPTSKSFSLTAFTGKENGSDIAKSITSNPNSLAFGIIHKSFSLNFSVHIKLSTPNLKYIKTPHIQINFIRFGSCEKPNLF